MIVPARSVRVLEHGVDLVGVTRDSLRDSLTTFNAIALRGNRRCKEFQRLLEIDADRQQHRSSQVPES
ncbi:MAG: hypothetical protein F4Z60_13060 [Chloroflexi bacterium]|nr:hypothetical protein [Chloroflexota bacterium]